jgi:hypothetical protein
VTDRAVTGEVVSEAAPARPPSAVAPAEHVDRRGSVWVVPDSVPAIVPRSIRSAEPHWVAVYRWAAVGGDLLAAVLGVSIALLTRFGYQVGGGYLMFGSVLPLAWVAAVALSKGYESSWTSLASTSTSHST